MPLKQNPTRWEMDGTPADLGACLEYFVGLWHRGGIRAWVKDGETEPTWELEINLTNGTHLQPGLTDVIFPAASGNYYVMTLDDYAAISGQG